MLKEFGSYVGAQFVGGILNTLFLYGVLIIDTIDMQIWVTNAYVKGAVNEATIFCRLFIEIILTFVFVYAFMGVTSKKEHLPVSVVVIGLAVPLVRLISINLTGTS